MLSAFRVRATFRRSFASIFFMTLTAAIAFAAEAPRFVEKDGRWALLVDGQPYLMLGGQVHNSSANLEADKTAFSALMRHLKTLDENEHTILLVQVENESGIIGSSRDFSPELNKEFAGQVPADMLSAAHKQQGTWSEVFRGDADELFQLYHQARYVNEIAAAGKAEFDIPVYINVWLSYPPAEAPERRIPIPGIQYPSGGAVQRWVGLWRALAPSIKAIAPDIYGDDAGFVHDVLTAYHRPDNPLLVPEIAKTDQ